MGLFGGIVVRICHCSFGGVGSVLNGIRNRVFSNFGLKTRPWGLSSSSTALKFLVQRCILCYNGFHRVVLSGPAEL